MANIGEKIAKNSAKNLLVFRRKLFYNHNFSEKLKALFDEYGEKEKVSSVFVGLLTKENWEDVLNSKQNHKDALNKVRGFSSRKILKFFGDVRGFIKEFDLGGEWEHTLITFIISKKFCPPWQNFDIDKNISRDRKRVVLILNPDTSLEDIEVFFDTIKNLQKKLLPDFKKTNLTQKSLKGFKKVFISEMVRIAEAEKENKEKISGYDEHFYKHDDIYGSEKTINKLRAKRRDAGENKKANNPVKFKSQLTLKEVSKKISGKNTKKEYQNFIQQRKRQRDKI